MSVGDYRSILEPTELLSELRRLLLLQHQADRLICRYLADLADGMAKWPALVMRFGDVHQLVRARFGLSVRSIRERIRVGRALRQLPALEAALTSGQLTYSRIREVTRVATPDNERVWVEVARRSSIRALEVRVADASGEPRVRPRGTSRDADKVKLSISNDAWELLRQAMLAERTASGLELTDDEALAAVARRALSQANSVPGERDGAAEAVEAGTTHSGSPSDGAAEAVEAGTTHSGSPSDGAAEAVEALSPDARLLLNLIRTGGSWDAGTLCEMTQMHPTRLASALLDLELAHLVTRGMFGVFEAAQGKKQGRTAQDSWLTMRGGGEVPVRARG